MVMRGGRNILASGLALLVAGCAAIGDHTATGGGQSPYIVGSDDSKENGLIFANKMQVNIVALLKAELGLEGWTFDKDRDTITPPRGDGKGSVGLSGKGVATTRLLAAVGYIKDEDTKKRIRRHLVNEMMAASDANCVVFVRQLRTAQVGSRLAADSVATTMAVASSLLSHQSAARNAAAVGGLAAAGGATFDRNVFANTAAELVSDEIVKLRRADKEVIEKRLSSSYDSWDISRAYDDMIVFQGDCSISRGLAQMRATLNGREQTILALRSARRRA